MPQLNNDTFILEIHECQWEEVVVEKNELGACQILEASKRQFVLVKKVKFVISSSLKFLFDVIEITLKRLSGVYYERNSFLINFSEFE